MILERLGSLTGIGVLLRSVLPYYCIFGILIAPLRPIRVCMEVQVPVVTLGAAAFVVALRDYAAGQTALGWLASGWFVLSVGCSG